MIRILVQSIGGILSLARLVVLFRFRFAGDYWTWRQHTAFGAGTPSSRLERLRATLEYARWIHRMRGL